MSLYVTDECICCSACEPECPWEAIFPEDDVPAAFAADVELNAITAARPREFVEATARQSRKPSPEEVTENKRRWHESLRSARPAKDAGGC